MDKAFVEHAVRAFLEWRKAHDCSKAAVYSGIDARAADASNTCYWQQERFFEALGDAMGECEPLRTELFGE